MLSVVVPAHNEEQCLPRMLEGLYEKLKHAHISHEIIVVNDHSVDGTNAAVKECQKNIPTLLLHHNSYPSGFGLAVRCGLDRYKGDYVAIMMADESDSPDDLVRFYKKIKEGYDCVFGSRFIRGGRTIDYPGLKLILNRFANHFIRLVFGIKYNDVTNAFKLYRRQTIDGLRPFLAPHFRTDAQDPSDAAARAAEDVPCRPPNDGRNPPVRAATDLRNETASRHETRRKEGIERKRPRFRP